MTPRFGPPPFFPWRPFGPLFFNPRDDEIVDLNGIVDHAGQQDIPTEPRGVSTRDKSRHGADEWDERYGASWNPVKVQPETYKIPKAWIFLASNTKIHLTMNY